MLGEPFYHAIMTVLSVVKAVRVNGKAIAREAQFVLLDRRGGKITLETDSGASLLWRTDRPWIRTAVPSP